MNMQPRPPEIFPGERGFALLECTAEEGYRNRGKTTGCRYEFAKGQRRYVDVRDLSGMSRDVFVKVGDADIDTPLPGAQEAPQLVGDSQGSEEDA